MDLGKKIRIIEVVPEKAPAGPAPVEPSPSKEPVPV